MIYTDLNSFKQSIGIEGRLIGLDVGSKNIGVSISDRNRQIATPKAVILHKNNSFAIGQLIDFFKANAVVGMVVGLPLNAKGEETKSSCSIRKFVDVFLKSFDIPVYFTNEYLTSFMAEDFLSETAGLSLKTHKSSIDKIAAAHILQSVLDELQ